MNLYLVLRLCVTWYLFKRYFRGIFLQSECQLFVALSFSISLLTIMLIKLIVLWQKGSFISWHIDFKVNNVFYFVLCAFLNLWIISSDVITIWTIFWAWFKTVLQLVWLLLICVSSLTLLHLINPFCLIFRLLVRVNQSWKFLVHFCHFSFAYKMKLCKCVIQTIIIDLIDFILLLLAKFTWT